MDQETYEYLIPIAIVIIICILSYLYSFTRTYREYKNITILLPSRKRPINLEKTIESFTKNSYDIDKIEIIVIIDSDDKETINILDKIKKKYDILVDIKESRGYYGFYTRLNEAAKNSHGRFIYFVDDDCIMKTKNWDNLIMNYDSDKLSILYAEKEENCWGFCHPIVTRGLYEKLGHFSIHNISDVYLRSIAEETKIMQKIPKLYTYELNCNEYASNPPRRCGGKANMNDKYTEKSNLSQSSYNKIINEILNDKNYKEYIGGEYRIKL